MLPHQKRICDEFLDIEAKLSKLKNFIGTDIFKSLEDVDRHLLEIQLDAMKNYAYILSQRIHRF